MGLFNNKKKWQSLPVEDVADALLSLPDKEAKKAIDDMKRGKIPGLTPKQQKKIEQDYKRASEGERGLAAIRDGLRGGGTGNRNYKNIPLKDRVHPSEYKRILEREAKKQGLL